ncbi:MCPT3 protease, partial [Atlantisia rogersi]|nr:MCPT3 protease [Atlantisia rogersi]
LYVLLTLLISFPGRIIGGWEAKPHSRPYMAYLIIKNATRTYSCGGFLIRPDAVLSAAHCVTGKGVTVTLGAHNVDKYEPSQQKFRVRHWVIHQKYSDKMLANDIVLLKLEPRAKLTKSVRCIDLPNQERLQPGTICKVAGWGQTSLKGHETSVMMEVDLKVQREKVCEDIFSSYLKQSMICTGDEKLRKSSSLGDSGGPFICNRKAHGIVSYGRENSIFPIVYTRVAYFEQWIRAELKKFALQDLPDSPS